MKIFADLRAVKSIRVYFFHVCVDYDCRQSKCKLNIQRFINLFPENLQKVIKKKNRKKNLKSKTTKPNSASIDCASDETREDLTQMIFTPYCSYFTIGKHDDLYQSNYACAVKTNTWLVCTTILFSFHFISYTFAVAHTHTKHTHIAVCVRACVRVVYERKPSNR